MVKVSIQDSSRMFDLSQFLPECGKTDPQGMRLSAGLLRVDSFQGTSVFAYNLLCQTSHADHLPVDCYL